MLPGCGRVDEAVAEDHRHPHLGAATAECGPVQRAALGGGDIGQRAAVQELQRHHAAPGELRDRTGEVDVGLVVERLAEALRIRRLPAEVELAERAPPELLGELSGPIRARLRYMVLQDARERRDDVEVLVDGGLDAVVLDLDRHVGAVGQPRGVDLGDRGHADRLLLEVGEQLVDGMAQLELDDAADDGHVLGLGMLLQLREAVLQRGRQHPADAQQLAQLDVDRAELLKGEPQPLALGAPADEVALRIGHVPLQPRRRVAAQARGQAVATENAHGVREAGGVGAQRGDAAVHGHASHDRGSATRSLPDGRRAGAPARGRTRPP